MQRVKVPLGRIRAAQLRALAWLAQRYTPAYPLHLTTRQDFELHGVRAEDLPAVQRGICEAGLTSVGACGDSLRNVTVCAGSGLDGGTWDVADLAKSVRTFAESLPWIRQLPRKFKISLSGCRRACARPWINDLGLVANPDGSLSVVVAGSLGPRPATGILLHQRMTPGEVLPLLAAVLKLFHAEGDRQRRARARLRHVRERLGDEEFRRRLDELVRREDGASASFEPRLRQVEQATPLRARLALPLGDMAPQAAVELADAVDAAGGEIRLGFQHDLLVYGDAPPRLSPTLKSLVDRPRVVACPGSTWCTRGIVDSRAAARRILSVLPDPCDLNVAVSGCPNNCPHAAVADIGLVGSIQKVDGRRRECFRVLVGGGNGQTPDLAAPLGAAVAFEHVDQAVHQVVGEPMP
jgi:sulfite reductase beta subunit-like hemoprotein